MNAGNFLFPRYAAAGIAGFVTAIGIGCFFGLMDDGDPTSLTSVTAVAFAATLVGGFCFPISSRWFRALILVGFGLLFYCSTTLDPNDSFLELNPFPCFFPLAYGGLAAVVFHFIIFVLNFAFKQGSTYFQQIHCARQ
jgi:hypothetical protein